MDYGSTLTDATAPPDLTLGMRPVAPAAADALRAAAETGVTLALLSNTTPDQDRRTALAAAGLDTLFEDRVYLAHETGLAKPDPAAFEYVLDDLGVDPDEALSLGNNPENDIAPAVQIGMRAVLVSRWPMGHMLPGAIWISSITSLPALLTRPHTIPQPQPGFGDGAA